MTPLIVARALHWVGSGMVILLLYVAFSTTIELKMAQPGNSGKLSVRISPVHRND